MKADHTGTHSEQQRARVGWRNATQTAFVGDRAGRCCTCSHWAGSNIDTRALCELMRCGTGRNASCDKRAPNGRRSRRTDA
ncbi:MAG: hypothetical protein EOL91_07240 [Actinobacteria bacterium]|nr:hypothetical protein [Actinomycetota bacterium]